MWNQESIRQAFAISFGLALLATLGCQSRRRDNTDTAASVLETVNGDNDSAVHDDDVRPFLLSESPDGYFELPWITLDNADEHAAEIKKRGITRIELWETVDERRQPQILRRICSACPNLKALSIVSWTFSREDLRKSLSDLAALEQVAAHSLQTIERGCG